MMGSKCYAMRGGGKTVDCAALCLTVLCGMCREEGAAKDPFGVREGGEDIAHNPGANGQASEMDES